MITRCHQSESNRSNKGRYAYTICLRDDFSVSTGRTVCATFLISHQARLTYLSNQRIRVL